MRKFLALPLVILLCFSTSYAYVYKAYFSHGTTSSYINSSSGAGVTFTVDTGANSVSFPISNFPVIMYGAGCNSPEYCPQSEIITISARSGNTFTIGARAQGGTTAQAWTISSNIKEVLDMTGGGGTWGSITGTLSDQTDLYGVLTGKEPTLSFSSPLLRSGNSISFDTSILNGKEDSLGVPSVDLYCLKSTIAGVRSWGSCGTGGGGGDFGGITSGTNNIAAMIAGTGASITYSGTGTINASGYQGQSTTTGTELGYIHGVTSAIQTQLDSKITSAGNAATATALASNPTDCADAYHFAYQIAASGNLTCAEPDYGHLLNTPTTFTPAAHASTHAAAGSDPITISESQVTGLTTDLSGKLGTSLTTDYTHVGIAGVATGVVLPSCSNGTTDKLLYSTSTHAFSCGVDQTAAGGTGITTLNTLTASTQSFATGTTGSDFNIVSSSATHTFHIPTASASVRGALASADWSTFNGKQANITASSSPNFYSWDKTFRQVTFDLLGTGTNTSATMTCGAGCNVGFTSSGIVNANRFNGNASVAGVNGGTGLTSLGAANQLLGMNSGATALEYKTVSAGTSGSDFNIVNGLNSLVLNLPVASDTVTGKLSYTDHLAFNGKLSPTGNGSGLTGLTSSQVGLGNVTNDAQLKRASGDFNSFTSKLTPISTDVLLLEDSVSSYAKKKVLLSNLVPTTKYALMTKSGSQSIANNTATAITWDTTAHDDLSFFSGLSPTRLTIPSGVTKVRLTFQSNWDSNVSGMRLGVIYKNGAVFAGTAADRRQAVTGITFPGISTANASTAILTVAPGDYFELFVLQDSTSARSFGADANICWFMIETVN